MAESQRFWPTQYWHPLDDGRIQCDLCPRYCQLREGKRGTCYIRQAHQGQVVLTSYGRASGFCIDPIEKKPLNHFYPGSAVLSFGTAGCNLGCKFCQNWAISKSRQMDTLGSPAMPEQIARCAAANHCRSVAYTYNDPVIFYEYALDTAAACRALGLFNVAVSAGYISPSPRVAFFNAMDACNIDLKGFSERFYHTLCGAALAPVLDTLIYIRHETQCWLEITTLLIEGENDSDAELEALCGWLVEKLGTDVPIHFSAFHPDFKMLDRPPTSAVTLKRAYQIAKQAGCQHVYIGNIHDAKLDSTYCARCGKCVIERDWYQLGRYTLNASGCCDHCGTPMPGRFAQHAEPFGRRKAVVDPSRY